MAELGITHAFNYCTLLPLTDTHMGVHTYMHTHTHTHTHTQGSRLCARRFTLGIAPDDWIKGDFFFFFFSAYLDFVQ